MSFNKRKLAETLTDMEKVEALTHALYMAAVVALPDTDDTLELTHNNWKLECHPATPHSPLTVTHDGENRVTYGYNEDGLLAVSVTAKPTAAGHDFLLSALRNLLIGVAYAGFELRRDDNVFDI